MTVADSIEGSRIGGVLALVAGATLLANPIWLGAVSIYPGTGWGFLPLFHAAFTALGLVTVATGVLSLRATRDALTIRELGLLAIVIVLFVPLYSLVLAATIGTGGPSIAGYGFRQAFVASLVVAAFFLGYGVGSRNRSTGLLALSVPAFPLVFVICDWRSGALLEPILELHVLLTGNPTGFPYLGPLVFAVAFALGLWSGRFTGCSTR